MFHSAHIHIPNRHRQGTALRTFFPSSSFSPPDSKEPLRRGILLSSVASVLLLVGFILIWLDFDDILGPLLIAVALFMLLLSLRQFHLARKRNGTNTGPMQLEAVGSTGVTALVVDQEECIGPTTVVIDAWEGERPENDGLRINEDFAPPSYLDVAQHSCSSNCPSFVSHDDRNEAPPTYEETCGEIVSYESETSLTQSSQQCSSQIETSLCPGSLDSHVNNYPDTHCHSAVAGTSHIPASSHTLSPGSALLISAWQRNMQKGTRNDKSPDINETSSNASISSEETIATMDTAAPRRQESMDSQTIKQAEWGKRSFSSIPSYTCLLSESGEVSAQVYNTSSIISQMLPNESESTSGATFDSFLGASTTGPTRSRSTSSINNLRQGVPYNVANPSIHIPANVQPTRLDSPGARRCSEGSRPSEDVTQGRGNGSRQQSDTNIASGSNITSFPLVIQKLNPKGSNSSTNSHPDKAIQEMAKTSGSRVSQLPTVRARPSVGQDVQETI